MNLLLLTTFTIWLCLYLEVTHLQVLSKISIRPRAFARSLHGSVPVRLRFVETTKENKDGKKKPGKDIKLYNSDNKDSVTYSSLMVQVLATHNTTAGSVNNKNKPHCMSVLSGRNVTNKKSSHRTSFLKEKNATNKILSNRISALTERHFTNKNELHYIRDVIKRNVTNKTLSHRISILMPRNVTSNNLSQSNYSKERNITMKNFSQRKERTIWQSEKRKRNTITVPFTFFRHLKDNNLSRNYSSSIRSTTRAESRVGRKLEVKTASNKQERDNSGSLPCNTSNYLKDKLTSKARQVNTDCFCENTKCDCSNRNLISVPQDLDTSINELALSQNAIHKLPTNVFFRYSLLEKLDLFDNAIDILENGSFNGLSSLTYLNLRSIHVKIINKLAFEPLKSLKILLFDFNIDGCNSSSKNQDTAFSYLHKLEELYIDNYINSEGEKEFGAEFNNMTSLLNLTITCNLACNRMQLWNTTFIYLGHITSLDVSSCYINGRYIETDTFSYLRNLHTLNISWNPDIGMEYLPVILWGLRNSDLQTLLMNHIVKEYSLNFINSSVVQYLPKKLTTLVARRNSILSIDSEAVKMLPKSLKTIDISENYIITDPKDLPFEEMEGLQTLLIHIRNDACLRSDKDYFIPSLDIVSDCEQHNGNGEIHFESKNTKVQKSGKGIPKNLKRVLINVENMPNDFLVNIDKQNCLQELDLSCSYIPIFDFSSLKQLPKLKAIDLRKSSVHMLKFSMNESNFLTILKLRSNKLSKFLSKTARPFSYFHNLTYLDLSKNTISVLHKTSFEKLDNIQYLRLTDNPLSQFDFDISNMVHLKLLDLGNTELSYLSNKVRSHINDLCKARPGQVTVNMADNPIQCDCFNLDFLKWMANSEAFDKNFAGYKCKYPDSSTKYIHDRYQETIRVLDRECAKNYPIFLFILVATFVLLIAVFGSIFYRLRWKVRYLYYAAYLKFTDKYKNDKNHEFTYDAFISYDSEDQAFVTRNLTPELENRGLRLLIHTRDFVAGTYITSNIVMAVSESRKTLVVLTRNLLESTWCNYELQMATMEAVHTGRQVLVFLLKENIPSRELDVELLGHIRSNTYLPYPTPEEERNESFMRKFYDKLAHDVKC